LPSFASGDNAGMKVVRRTRPARERPTEVTRVVEEGAAPPPEPPVGPWADRDLWPWLLLLLVLVVGGIVAAVLLTRDDGKKTAPATTVVASTPTQTVTVSRATTPEPATSPSAAVGRVKLANVLGIPAATAVTRLRQQGLQPVVRSVFSTKPRGIVAAQKPGPGTQVAKGATVALSVSKGQPAKPVPDVVGQEESQAVALLKSSGFEATVQRVPSDQPKDMVVAQKPKAGEKAQGGTKVLINVSAGAPSSSPATSAQATTARAAAPSPQPSSASRPQTVTVPDVVGKTLQQARLALRNAGLVTAIKYVPSAEPSGTVVAQARQPGSTAKRGDHMQINVSQGSEPASSLVAVPNVVGQDEATAQTRLQQAGFAPVVEDQPTSDPAQEGKVVDEQPAPGAKAPKGSQIILYVGRATSSG
jgi:beta-lactam-binding protein with PASTA domain